MKEFYKKHKKMTIGLSIIVFFVLVFVVPICINWLYERPAAASWLAMSWEAKDVLSFYGSILGSFATIIAVVVTIIFTVNNQKEERKLSIKPYLQTKFFNTTDINDEVFRQDFPYVLMHRTFSEMQSHKPKDLYELFALKLRYPNDATRINEHITEYFKHHYIMVYEIENYGANTAMAVKVEKQENITVKDFCVRTSESKKFIIILEDALLGSNNSYKFTFNITYADVVFLGHYVQSETFEFFRMSNGKLAIGQSGADFLSSPMEIKAQK